MSVEENVASRKKEKARKSYEQLTKSIENKKGAKSFITSSFY